MVDDSFLAQSYDAFVQVEEEFNEALDQTLDPRGPDLLFDVVAELALPDGATALDVGCGEGRHAIELAKRFNLRARGVDPVPRHIAVAMHEAREQARSFTGLLGSVTFGTGTAEELPVEDQTVDLIWCRDVLVHVDDLNAAYGEFRRVLKPGGRALIYQMFATDRLEPQEAGWLLPTMGCVAASMVPEHAEAAIEAAGLRIDRRIVLGTEWAEWGHEHSGKGGRKLLHAARLLREPDRYIERFGQANYDIALGDSLWHVYRLIGKLSDRIYLLSSPARP
ncbi:class I SAM-dependent methyltransferase [Nonomuraea angiospora]|uniref:class I SAM-dependent methyltransferase n=1 Tax=Nonomuraea angiospora TaxID=46172 RepID=UPI0034207461